MTTPAALAARLRELLTEPHDAMDYMRFVLTNQTTIIRLLEAVDGSTEDLAKFAEARGEEDGPNDAFDDALTALVLYKPTQRVSAYKLFADALRALATLRAAREGAR